MAKLMCWIFGHKTANACVAKVYRLDNRTSEWNCPRCGKVVHGTW